MNNLAAKECIPCHAGESPLSDVEIAELILQVPQWTTLVQDDCVRLQRVFKFKNYADALEFTNKCATLAEAADHHPLIVLEWGKVAVQWWTHAVRGLHHNDFIMAAKVDRLVVSS